MDLLSDVEQSTEHELAVATTGTSSTLYRRLYAEQPMSSDARRVGHIQSVTQLSNPETAHASSYRSVRRSKRSRLSARVSSDRPVSMNLRSRLTAPFWSALIRRVGVAMRQRDLAALDESLFTYAALTSRGIAILRPHPEMHGFRMLRWCVQEFIV